MRMVLVCDVKDVSAFMGHRAERQANIGNFADDICEYAVDGANKIAVSFNVTDRYKMEEIMASESTKAEMVEHGVLPETLQMFFER